MGLYGYSWCDLSIDIAIAEPNYSQYNKRPEHSFLMDEEQG